ncbi:threonine--tRNA ligase [Lichenicoccus sp.]|uniref:threonine--tRNA ligase n=1 Tax=Lichenicoccus sp. TaxID=2781899 RepID=UPI003D0B4FAA
MDEVDHRSLGSRLDLWHLQEDAPGMVFWHPRGYAIYRVLEDYIRTRMRRLGYAEVRSPQLIPRDLWIRSGHWDKFGENMFVVGSGERPMALKPMSCPCHVQIFNKGLRSWRDLPIRYSEFGACHRDEPSGALHGLMRTRAFEQDDAHVFCREEDIQREVARFIDCLSEVYTDFGFPEFDMALSTRPALRAGSEDLWDWAEKTLGDAATCSGVSFSIQPGEGAFYGPKLEFALRDRLGRSWQCGTIQLDCVLPARLAASYIAPDGRRAVPLMLHHVVFGSLGRFVAILIEHHGGVLPFWLSPEQVAITPISQEQADYATEVMNMLDACGLRVIAYGGSETLSRRIVAAREAEVPVMAIVGRREQEDRTITLRERDGAQATLSWADASAALSSRH